MIIGTLNYREYKCDCGQSMIDRIPIADYKVGFFKRKRYYQYRYTCHCGKESRIYEIDVTDRKWT